VFEAAARLDSFVQAADELGISPAAVSQQVRKLEDRLQVRLFERVGRQVRVSPIGKDLQIRISESLKQIDDAFKELLDPPERNHISISTVSSLATRWLVPRLSQWRQTNSEIDIRVSTSGRLVDFERDQIDLSIRLGDGNHSGCHSELLTQDTIVPLCHPKIVDGVSSQKGAAKLSEHTLIHFTPIVGDVRTGWKSWLDLNGIDDVNSERGLFFDNLSSAIGAAITGQGVVLALRSLVDDELKSGQLVIPFDDIKHPEIGWHFVTTYKNLEHKNVSKFRKWLVAQFVEKPA
jgi:LysR family glycine cleavage system transcriptional activator